MRTSRPFTIHPRLRPPALLVAAALLTAIAPLTAQTTKHEIVDLSRVGPKVGERVPDFTLRDQTGRSRTLASVMGPKGAMLVFFRSADW